MRQLPDTLDHLTHTQFPSDSFPDDDDDDGRLMNFLPPNFLQPAVAALEKPVEKWSNRAPAHKKHRRHENVPPTMSEENVNEK